MPSPWRWMVSPEGPLPQPEGKDALVAISALRTRAFMSCVTLSDLSAWAVHLILAKCSSLRHSSLVIVASRGSKRRHRSRWKKLFSDSLAQSPFSTIVPRQARDDANWTPSRASHKRYQSFHHCDTSHFITALLESGRLHGWAAYRKSKYSKRPQSTNTQPGHGTFIDCRILTLYLSKPSHPRYASITSFPPISAVRGSQKRP